jgi:hypothetical protein
MIGMAAVAEVQPEDVGAGLRHALMVAPSELDGPRVAMILAWLGRRV